MKKLFSFRGGTHPPERKKSTEDFKTEVFPAPKKVYINLLQHIGNPLDPIVKKGEEVKVGQKIADSKAFLSVPVHSSVSGKVLQIDTYPYSVNGFVKTIIIENDEKEEWIETKGIKNFKSLSKEKLLEIIREAGIVGLGGAAFPTHIKLNPPADKNIDTLLINGAECEPYLNADNRLMLENAKEFISGVKILMYILNVKKTIIGIENNKTEAINHLNKLLEKQEGITVAALKTKYPQGGEKQLIKAVLNREVPARKLPLDVGVVVQNVGTAKAIHDAVIEGKPLIERVLTVSGEGVKTPKNLLVKIGTQFKEVLNYAEFNQEITQRIVSGGPMMGIGQFTTDVPVIKGTSGILALTKNETKPYKPKSCILCAKCVTVCPLNLIPMMFAKLARFSEWEEMDRYNLMDCMECGTCQYICPANRPLTEAIKLGKAKLRTIKK